MGKDRRKSPGYLYISEAKSEESSRCAWTQSKLKGQPGQLSETLKIETDEAEDTEKG